MASIGIVIRQLPGFALQAGPGSSDYITEMAKLHDRYDPLFGATFVDVLERAQVFRVFSSAWFSGALVILLISIVVCTLDRTPRLWRQTVDIRVAQPDGFFDPRLPDRLVGLGCLVAQGRKGEHGVAKLVLSEGRAGRFGHVARLLGKDVMELLPHLIAS